MSNESSGKTLQRETNQRSSMMCMIIQRSIMLLITDMVRPHAVYADFLIELGKHTSCSMLYQRVSPFCTNIGDRGIFHHAVDTCIDFLR